MRGADRRPGHDSRRLSVSLRSKAQIDRARATAARSSSSSAPPQNRESAAVHSVGLSCASHPESRRMQSISRCVAESPREKVREGGSETLNEAHS
jgi:hypothetical protein